MCITRFSRERYEKRDNKLLAVAIAGGWEHLRWEVSLFTLCSVWFELACKYLLFFGKTKAQSRGWLDMHTSALLLCF